jgi:3D (Asp-Asp-Asp) domain-containing protein
LRVGDWVEDGVEYFTPEPGAERYYNGRPIRPVKTVWMVTTAYSPDRRSCGDWADGKTASMKSVWTNAMNSVAADTRLLPFGTLLSVPGYADDDVVPVLDRGGAIKGARLDLLYPTHQIARQWGVQRLPVTIWEYAD